MPITVHPPKFWYQKNLISYLLAPFALLFRIIIAIRKFIYLHIVKPKKFSVPIIVVGNIIVGGSGKTPLVIWLAGFLKEHGFKPGIVSRGYGGKSRKNYCIVTPESDVSEVGDEPLIIARRTDCPMVVCANRVRAVEKLLANYACDVVISDDGLQHYALARDIEIAVLDGAREFGNGFCLPAGPLREPISRLERVDFMIKNLHVKMTCECFSMKAVSCALRNVKYPHLTKELDDFAGLKIHAVAGIGNPDRFFCMLRFLKMRIVEHVFPDHHKFVAADFPFANEIVIMTEKDAVKCVNIAGEDFWYLPITLQVDKEFSETFLNKVKMIYLSPMKMRT